MNDVEPQRPLRVFLCHSTSDKEAIRDLYRRLVNDGIEPWLDEENILPGQDWHQEITKAIRNVDIVIVCFSNKSVNKTGYIQREIKYALDVADEQPAGAIFLIPLKLEECEIPDALRRWQYVNYFEESGYERLMKALRHRAMTLGVLAGGLRIRSARRNESTEARVGSLTRREREVIKLVALGLTNKQIAESMAVTSAQVRQYLSYVFNKLAIADRFDLIIYAYQHGLTSHAEHEEGPLQMDAAEPAAGERSALLISDGTEFADELGALSRQAGFRLVSFPRALLHRQTEIIEEGSLAPYELVILVRGEDFTQITNERFYSMLSRFVFDGGKLFATSWVAWENDRHGILNDALPFKHVTDTFDENLPVTCGPAGGELSKRLFHSEMSFRTSFETLTRREGSTVLGEMSDGTPFFGFRRYGLGNCYYLNSCQHSCDISMASPLSGSSLSASLARVFEWIFESSN